MNRTYAPDEVADGTCNPTPTCSKSDEDYNADDTTGPFLLRGATCRTATQTTPQQRCGHTTPQGMTRTRRAIGAAAWEVSIM
jgi:hypothetical protein